MIDFWIPILLVCVTGQPCVNFAKGMRTFDSFDECQQAVQALHERNREVIASLGEWRIFEDCRTKRGIQA